MNLMKPKQLLLSCIYVYVYHFAITINKKKLPDSTLPITQFTLYVN